MILYKTKTGKVVSISEDNGNDVDVNLDNYLSKDNEKFYSPSHDYNPATKKYVDDILGDIGKVLDDINRVSEVDS